MTATPEEKLADAKQAWLDAVVAEEELRDCRSEVAIHVAAYQRRETLSAYRRARNNMIQGLN